MTHLTLIKPNIGRMEHSLYVDEGRMEPLNIAVLAGLTPDDIEITFFDDRMEPIDYDAPTDVVAITVETYTARRSYEIAAEYRSRGVPVVMGGVHPTLLPEEVEAHCDCMVTGDAETIWEGILKDFKNGQLQKRYHGAPGVGQLAGTLPRRDIFAGKGYLGMTLMQFSRGCPYRCSFCAVSEYFDRGFHVRNIDRVLEEIEEQQRRFIFFIDDNIAGDRKALKELCAALIPMRIQWISQATIDTTSDPELMRLMRDSGCVGNVVGIESITDESLVEMRKGNNLHHRKNRFEEQLKILDDYGLLTWAAFTLGHDHDTLASIEATAEFAVRHRFAFAAFNILVPYPNTDLYRKLEAQGRLLFDGKWWLHPEYRFNQASFVPTRMTPNELTDACHQARSLFNAPPSLVSRMLERKNRRTLALMIRVAWYQWLFRKEVYKKHQMRFGLYGHDTASA